MAYSSSNPNAFGEPHGMPLNVSAGKAHFICKEPVAPEVGTGLCNKVIGDSGCGGRHMMMRTPFIKRVASGEHGNSIAGLVRGGH